MLGPAADSGGTGSVPSEEGVNPRALAGAALPGERNPIGAEPHKVLAPPILPRQLHQGRNIRQLHNRQLHPIHQRLRTLPQNLRQCQARRLPSRRPPLRQETLRRSQPHLHDGPGPQKPPPSDRPQLHSQGPLHLHPTPADLVKLPQCPS
ncbi:hypothetical protein Fmac_009084 [Flemingia macrophylla]|uniref:Uncharacterized protein n=1 Tax=Flemingia macrophylla TaxID=520843 RepID=A0ABD1MZB7_9FABA